MAEEVRRHPLHGVDLRPYDALSVSRRHDQDMDMYDPGPYVPAYVDRLQNFSNRVRQQLPNEPGSFEVHKRLIENVPELIRGHSNLTADPDAYFHPRAQMYNFSKQPEYFGPGAPWEWAEGAVNPNSATNVLLNPKHVVMGTSALLGHEMGHAGHLSMERKAAIQQQTNPNVRSSVYDWAPMFSPDFMKAAARETKKKTSPYYYRPDFGQFPDETFAYLLGREAELPRGKTLLDDPGTAQLFKQFPDMYLEYTVARDKIRRSWQSPKR